MYIGFFFGACEVRPVVGRTFGVSSFGGGQLQLISELEWFGCACAWLVMCSAKTDNDLKKKRCGFFVIVLVSLPQEFGFSSGGVAVDRTPEAAT